MTLPNELCILKFPLHGFIKIIKSFLLNRTFNVSVGNGKSNKFQIVAGNAAFPFCAIFSCLLVKLLPTHVMKEGLIYYFH